jgi:hypothetical protein
MGHTSSMGALRALYCGAPWCLYRGATSDGRAGKGSRSLRFDWGEVPISWVKAELRQVSCYPSSPLPPPPRPWPGDRLLLLWAKGRRFTVMPHGSSATYGDMTHSFIEWTIVLENLASSGRHGESCACPEATSRVAVWELLVRSPSVRRLEGWADRRPGAAQRRHAGVPSSWAPTVSVMMLQCQGWRLLTVNSCTKVHLDMQADKSPVVVKGPFFPRVANPRYRIRGTNVRRKRWSSKAKQLQSSVQWNPNASR